MKIEIIGMSLKISNSKDPSSFLKEENKSFKIAKHDDKFYLERKMHSNFCTKRTLLTWLWNLGIIHKLCNKKAGRGWVVWLWTFYFCIRRISVSLIGPRNLFAPTELLIKLLRTCFTLQNLISWKHSFNLIMILPKFKYN